MNLIYFLIKEKFNYRLNIIRSFWTSWHYFGFSHALIFPILLYGKIQYWNKGSIRIDISSNSLKTGIISIGKGANLLCPKYDLTRINNNGEIIIRGGGKFYCGAKIFVAPQAKLVIGKNFHFGWNLRIACFENINIGDNALFSWNIQLMDSDMHYSIIDNKILKNSKPIFIGNSVWLANGISIMKGSKIPDNSCVASQSLVNKDFSNFSTILLAGIPAKVITESFKMIRGREIERELDKYFQNSPNAIMADITSFLK